MVVWYCTAVLETTPRWLHSSVKLSHEDDRCTTGHGVYQRSLVSCISYSNGFGNGIIDQRNKIFSINLSLAFLKIIIPKNGKRFNFHSVRLPHL